MFTPGPLPRFLRTAFKLKLLFNADRFDQGDRESALIIYDPADQKHYLHLDA